MNNGKRIKVHDLFVSRGEADLAVFAGAAAAAGTGPANPATPAAAAAGAGPATPGTPVLFGAPATPQSAALEEEADAPPPSRFAAFGESQDSAVDVDVAASEESASVFCQEVAAWISTLHAEALQEGLSLPTVVEKRFPMSSVMRHAIIAKVPWDTKKGLLTMQSLPRGKCKGHAHVAMLNYSPRAFLGQGLYTSDAIVWLQHATFPLKVPRLDVSPVAVATGTDLSNFGWATEGAMVNSTVAFALIACALFAVVMNRQIPESVRSVLQDIPTLYAKEADPIQKNCEQHGRQCCEQ